MCDAPANRRLPDLDSECARRHLDLDLFDIAVLDELTSIQVVMNDGWYYQQQRQNARQQYQTATPPSRVTADAVNDSHSLLAAYPFASATPSSHGETVVPHKFVPESYYSIVARHLSGLSLTATPPSYYIQSAMYSQQYIPPTSTYSSQYSSQLSDYTQELSHLASPSAPYDDAGYWEAERNNAVRYIAEDASCVICV